MGLHPAQVLPIMALMFGISNVAVPNIPGMKTFGVAKNFEVSFAA
jgi:hypothetical protein